jgi:hypothetical protein
MKELYSFVVKREVEKQVPYVKKTKDGPVESFKKSKTTVKNRIVLVKPSMSDVEDAEFFYGQKYNSFINSGFLTKAMLAKKMGDLGGMTSKKAEDVMSAVLLENIEASRVIEFFDESENLSEEQEKTLKDAKLKFAETQKQMLEYEVALRDQFSQTADARAEQKLIEWFVINFSFYEDTVKEKEDEKEKKDLFPLFEGEIYKEKRNFLLSLQEPEDDIEDAQLLRIKNLFDSSFETLIRAVTIWYNKLGTDQKSIDEALTEFFDVPK